MSAYTAVLDLDEIGRRLAPVATGRLGQSLYRQRRRSGGAGADTGVAGFSLATLDAFETGRRRPDAAAVAALIVAYGCSIDDLVPERRPLDPNLLDDRSETQVLEQYLAQVRAWRNRDGRQVQFRQEDIEVLVGILTTDPDEIVRRLVELTGCGRTTAKRLRRMLLGAVALASTSTLGAVAMTRSPGMGAPGAAPTAAVVQPAQPVTGAAAQVGSTVVPAPSEASASASTVPAGTTGAAPAVAADTTDFAFWNVTSSGVAYRWDPCRAVTVAYLSEPGAPALDVASAVARLARATGLTIEVVSSPGADITVAFAPRVGAGLAGTTTQKWDSHGFIDHASIVLAPATPPGLMEEALLHELGHAVGLAHAPRPGQVMDPVLTGQADYQAGDLAGLEALGPRGDPTCAPVPSAR